MGQAESWTAECEGIEMINLKASVGEMIKGAQCVTRLSQEL